MSNTRPFNRIDAQVTMHTAHGVFRLTVENAAGPASPEQLGEYIAERVQAQYDEVRSVPSPKAVELQQLEKSLRESTALIDDLQKQVEQMRDAATARQESVPSAPRRISRRQAQDTGAA